MIAPLAAHAWRLALLGLLAVGSGFFSGTETALFNLTRGQVHRLGRAHRAGALVVALLRRPRSLLYTLLLGNMLVNVAYAGVSATVIFALKDVGASAWVVAATPVVLLAVLILLGEVTPKMLAAAGSERWSLVTCVPLAAVQRALAPLVWVLERAFVSPLVTVIAPRPTVRTCITPSELAAVLDLSAKRGIVDRDVTVMLQEIVELTDLRVTDIMVPRVDMVAFDADGTREELVALLRRTGLRRVPVYEDGPDRVIGTIHARRVLLHPDAPLRELIGKVPFVPETATVEHLLRQLRERGAQLAIVVDEYGGTAGLVTMEDALEEIVGDIPDPQDRREGPAVTELSDRQYVIDAELGIHEWADAFAIDLSAHRVSTVGGFVTSLLGRIPQAGDVTTYRNLRFTVDSMCGRRIDKLRVELLEAPQ
ncbi:MAG: HlyC/CorC family transporter [Phycisphaerae bacterium]|nr:HlyC/CorC family transporter [Phycisphaerae bacterium]